MKSVDTGIFPIPLPLRGLNTVSAVDDITSGYARELTNLMIVDGKIAMRPAVRNLVNSGAGYGTSNFANTQVKWFDFDSGTSTYAAITARPDGGGSVISEVRRLDVNGTLVSTLPIGSGPGISLTEIQSAAHVSLNLIFGQAEPRSANFPFSSWGFTTISIPAANIYCGASHRGRLYVASGQNIEYSNPGATAGAMVGSLNVSQFFDGGRIERMVSISASNGLQVKPFLCIFSSSGRVLVYSGGDPATDFELVGQFQMPPPVGKNGFVEVDGDCLVITSRYAYWIRDLFLNGAQSAYQNSPSVPIENFWQTCDWTSSPNISNGAYAAYIDNINGYAVDAIICAPRYLKNIGSVGNYQKQFGSSIDTQTGMLVYFRKTRSWALWLSQSFLWPIRKLGGSTLGKATGLALLELANSVQDSTLNTNMTAVTDDIYTSWKTPYFSPFARQQSRVVGARPYYKNTGSGDGDLFKIGVIADYSDYNQRWGWFSQPNVLIVDRLEPGKSSSTKLAVSPNNHRIYSDFVNIGLTGVNVSLHVSQRGNATYGVSQIHEIMGLSLYAQGGGIL